MIVGGDRAVVTIPIKGCCGVLAGDVCDCAEFAAEAAVRFINPLILRTRRRPDAGPSTTYPTPIVDADGGQIRPVKGSHE